MSKKNQAPGPKKSTNPLDTMYGPQDGAMIPRPLRVVGGILTPARNTVFRFSDGHTALTPVPESGFAEGFFIRVKFGVHAGRRRILTDRWQCIDPEDSDRSVQETHIFIPDNTPPDWAYIQVNVRRIPLINRDGRPVMAYFPIGVADNSNEAKIQLHQEYINVAGEADLAEKYPQSLDPDAFLEAFAVTELESAIDVL